MPVDLARKEPNYSANEIDYPPSGMFTELFSPNTVEAGPLDCEWDFQVADCDFKISPQEKKAKKLPNINELQRTTEREF